MRCSQRQVQGKLAYARRLALEYLRETTAAHAAFLAQIEIASDLIRMSSKTDDYDLPTVGGGKRQTAGQTRPGVAQARSRFGSVQNG
jgi:hypothetical protein